MRCLAIMLSESGGNEPSPVGLYLAGIWHIRYAPRFPTQSRFILYVEIEVDQSERGLPADTQFDFVDGTGNTVFSTRATGIKQMPKHPSMPVIFTISATVEMSFPHPGRYDVNVYVDGELAATRPFAVVQAATEHEHVPEP